MEIDEDVYRKFSWNPTVITRAKEDIFSTEPIVDLTAESFLTMRQQELVNRQKFNEIYMKIQDRYNYENKWREHYASNYRSDFTPRQKRRIRKQTWKWRKRLIGEYF